MNTLSVENLEKINGGTDSSGTDLGQFIGGFLSGLDDWGGFYVCLFKGIASMLQDKHLEVD
jgi:hypothetical protein